MRVCILTDRWSAVNKCVRFLKLSGKVSWIFRYSKSFVVQGRLRGVRVSRARAQEIKSPVYASLHFFSKNFWEKLDFLLRNNYPFLSAGDCHYRNRLVLVVFKLCKRIISPINIQLPTLGLCSRPFSDHVSRTWIFRL